MKRVKVEYKIVYTPVSIFPCKSAADALSKNVSKRLAARTKYKKRYQARLRYAKKK